MSYALRAINDTFVFLVLQQNEEDYRYMRKTNVFFLHTDSRGKTLFMRAMKSKQLWGVCVEMSSPKQVVVSDSADRKLWLIDLETHKEWSTTVDT